MIGCRLDDSTGLINYDEAELCILSSLGFVEYQMFTAKCTQNLMQKIVDLQTMGYRLDESTGLINYDEAELLAQLYRPKLIIGGASAYTRHVDYARLKQIAEKANAYLLSDIAHISGLVAAGV